MVKKLTKQAEALAKVKAELEGHLADLTRDLATVSGVVLDEAHVVIMNNTYCLKFDIVGGNPINPKPCRAIEATRFEASVAARIAAMTKNGNGDVGRAIHVRYAIERQIVNIHDALEDLPKI